jgi:putative oxidoreductase
MSSSPSRSVELNITLLRAGPGTTWIAHAMLQLFVFTLPGTAPYFVRIGFGGCVAYPLFAAERLGDGALSLSRGARLASRL